MKRGYREVTLSLEDRHWWYRGRRRLVRAVTEKLPLERPASVLDAGCGGGANLAELARLGRVTGVEPSDEARSAAEARGVGPVVGGTVEELPFADGEFDLATALDVIEHTDDDVAALRELRRVVRPGGFLVLTVPAYQRLYGPHDVANEHRRRYVRPGLSEAATAAGWTELRSSYFNSLLLPPAAVHRAIQRRRSNEPPAVSDFERTPGWANWALELPLRAEARLIGAGGRLPAGLSVVAVYRNDSAAPDRSSA